MVTTATSGKSGSASAGMAETDRGLTPAETTLLAHAALGRIDRSSLSEKEEEALALFDLIEEQRLERALLLQDHDDLDVGEQRDLQAALASAQQELLDARALHEVTRRATRAVLMTDPGVRAVYSQSPTPIERRLLSLLVRRDALSMILQAFDSERSTCLASLSATEVKNLELIEENQRLVQAILAITQKEESWRDEITDPKARAQLATLETALSQATAKYRLLKHVVSATVAASGVDWAGDARLTELILDDE